MSTLRSVMIRASYTEGRTRVFTLGDLPNDDPLRDIAIFASAADVSLYNPHFLGGAALPSLPSLRRLNLYIPSACSVQDVRNVFQASELPNIQELALTFTREPGAAYTSRSARDVEGFVCGFHQTPQTVIRGADVIEPGLTELRARVSSLRVDSHLRVLDAEPLWVRAAAFGGI